MAPTTDDAAAPRGPHPSYIEVAAPYLFDHTIQLRLSSLGMTEAKEDAVRLQGVSWIDNVRRSLQLPVKTFNTAVVYYHKFRLLHADHEYSWVDAAAAALFTACKIEDTLKKSREILCASWNLKVPAGDALSPDDPRFENHSKTIIGLERLMLESAGFDFRNRYPQKLLVKLAKECGLERDQAGKTAFNMSLDLYRTFAPLKQTTSTMAIACVELAARLWEMDLTSIVGHKGINLEKWGTSRAEVMETLLDLLDLYTHHRPSTSIGPLYALETFINIRITLNQEAKSANLPRYTGTSSSPKSPLANATNGTRPRNGIAPTSPPTPLTPGTISPGQPTAPTSAIGVRGQSGTVRFMLDAARAKNERIEVEKYHKVEVEEYEVEVAVEPDRRQRVR
ncbi:cyclin-like protein [Lindgomyces ingoldianus]|uniref:Cyclin-like protein n=1 Tax=Lindgomyces ingoldianus TaxID=673940 RepID=A0ACB6QMD4_9PLEO|nr:cyclin-like protein [Lindgomyces ingoldianus]KAF2467301.1 cyclin-like protein [Lindgomyces ingoldianus]